MTLTMTSCLADPVRRLLFKKVSVDPSRLFLVQSFDPFQRRGVIREAMGINMAMMMGTLW